MSRRKIIIQFHSFWHAGSGQGQGVEVDSQVLKDQELPFFPGRTLKGLLAEAAGDLNRMGESALTAELCKEWFGTPDTSDSSGNSGRLRFGNAVLPEADRLELGLYPELIPALYATPSFTAINDSGTALKSSLRRIEAVIPLTLEAPLDGLKDGEESMLKLCCAYIKRAGLRRSRGWGRCTVSLSGEEMPQGGKK